MPANRQKTGKKANDTSFRPGQSGNPSGRPRKRRELTEMCQRFVDQECIDKLSEIVLRGKDRDALSAIEILLAYAYGKPTSQDRLELAGAVSTSITLKWAV